jgi:hypothetical protein
MGRVGHIRDCRSAKRSGTRSSHREGCAPRLIGEVHRRGPIQGTFEFQRCARLTPRRISYIRPMSHTRN